MKKLQRSTWGRPLLIAFVMSIFSLTVLAQRNTTVTGKVTDENGLPLPGATVKLQSGTANAITDLNGTFTIQVPEPISGKVLTVSFISYSTKQVTINSGTVNIALTPDNQTLTSVVVVGYGSQKKSDVTGSIVGIKGDNLREVPAPNAIQALQGRLAGVDIQNNSSRPGAGGQIRIRGSRSLSAGNDPFIVVDGIPFGGSLNDINNDDIASIDVLKDASSTAIYGSRGSNGVILITTKRGKPGKPQLSYNFWHGTNKVRGQYDVFNGPEFVAFRSSIPGGYTGGYSALEQQGIANGTSTNWQDYLYKTGTTQNHDLSVVGGGEGTNYGISTGYFKDDGVIQGQSFERFSLNSNVDVTVNKIIKVGLTTRNTLTYNNGDGINPLYNTMRITPLVGPYNADGSIRLFPQAGTVDETATANPLTLYDQENIVDRRRRIRTFNSAYLEANIWKGLKYRFNLGLDFSQEQRGQFYGPNTIMRPTAATVASALAQTDNTEAWRATLENLLYYNTTIAQDHRIDFTGLMSTQYDRSFANGFNAIGFPSVANQYYQFNLALGQIQAAGNNFFGRGRLQSYMARINYAYKDRYLLTGTYRRDGSSVFPQNKYLSYAAFAAGWNVMNESFMKSIKAVSTLKVRLTYGATGQQGIPGDATRGTLANNRYTFGAENVQGYFISQLPNVNLRWENTKSWNLALDFGFLNNRISGSVDFYKQNTNNLILLKALPRSEGADNYYENVGATSGKGVDFTISSLNITSNKNGFTWNTDFNFNINRERVERLGDANTLRDVGNGWFVGQPTNVIYDFTKLGIWQTSEAVEAARYGAVPGNIKIADLNNDGQITPAGDRSIIGTFQPKITMGMTQRFTYKGFDLSVVAFSRLGNKLVAPYLSADPAGSGGYFALLNGRVNQPKVDYWTPTNPTNAFPRPNPGTSITYSRTLSYFDGSFIKIRTINLGYTLPDNWTSKAGLKSIRIYATAQNPFILYSPFVKSGYGMDPEGNQTGGFQGADSDRAVQSGAITVNLNTPSTRQFIFGVTARF